MFIKNIAHRHNFIKMYPFTQLLELKFHTFRTTDKRTSSHLFHHSTLLVVNRDLLEIDWAKVWFLLGMHLGFPNVFF